MRLTDFQDGLSAALLHASPLPPAPWLAALAAQPGFAVYGNTVLKGCIDALQASYPTVFQLVGEDWFRAAAAVYARQQPPRDGLLMHYGATFGNFLAGFEPAAELPYLPAVARLDRCWTECHLAADATALNATWLALQTPDALDGLRLHPHPAARWAWCDEHPAYALWQHHRDGVPMAATGDWVGDGGLLTRPQAAVTWRPLPRAGAVFLNACAAGQTLEAAATHTLTEHPATDFGALMGALLDAGALIHTPSPPPTKEAP